MSVKDVGNTFLVDRCGSYDAGQIRRTPRERGLLFVGIDVIDGHLTEINVTSPTGIRAIARLDGPDVAAKIWDAIEKKRAG
jgi:glutathione synthase/RimK-type ligase-like ATP-grasp enzyme